jgi:predicted glycosyltransferase
MSRPALLFYCQHSVGLGHLTRSYALSRALTQRFRVVLVCGGPVPDGIAPPEGVEVVALPPVGVGADGRFGSHDPALSLDEAWAARRERMLAALADVRPAVVLVELFPFGRAKFARELVPLLEAARAAGAATASSVRDILVSRRRDQRAHDERAAARANAQLDAVLVHSDPAFARLEDTFAPVRRLTVPVHHTGFVVRNGDSPPNGARGLVVSAGGGRVGGPLLRAAAGARRLLGSELPMRLVAGPFLPADDWRALAAADGVELVRTVPDLAAELRGAVASVSQCGYNTALDVVRAGVPALVVPYATPQEDEQLRRARRLERLGAVRVLDPARLGSATLARAIEQVLRFEPAPPRLDTGGARRTAEILWEMVA